MLLAIAILLVLKLIRVLEFCFEVIILIYVLSYRRHVWLVWHAVCFNQVYLFSDIYVAYII